MQIYLDNAATTKMSKKAIEAMLPYMDTVYGNPSSLHSAGQVAAEALTDVRQRIAACIGASPKEITFTSGGSEADNQAILSAARLGERGGKKHIVSTAFEHHAVLHARIEEQDGKFLLKKALDETKDQSYVLYSMTQEQLAHTKFPLGSLRKSEVRQIAKQNGFVNADKPDSQDICFVPNGDYGSVIQHHAKNTRTTGNFVDKQGNILGQHKGIIHYTVGQRRGLGISASEPLYVCGISPQSGNIVLGHECDLFCREAEIVDFNWISGDVPHNGFSCKAKIRYRQQEQPAHVTPIGNSRVRITFEEPQRAITPGQAAVLYDGDIVLGGGTIQSSDA